MFTPIQSTDSVQQFVGQIVSFKTKEFYYGKDHAYSNNNEIFYGYITEQPNQLCHLDEIDEKCHSLIKLIYTQSNKTVSLLNNRMLEKHPLEMKKITKEELSKISKAIESGNAIFEVTTEKIAHLIGLHKNQMVIHHHLDLEDKITV